MNLSKMNFALVGFMVIGVFSLNFTNPFAMPNSEFDVKGVANEISISTTSTQAEDAAIPLPISVAVIQATMWVVFNSKICSCDDYRSDANIDVFDGAAKVDTNKLAMNKLD